MVVQKDGCPQRLPAISCLSSGWDGEDRLSLDISACWLLVPDGARKAEEGEIFSVLLPQPFKASRDFLWITHSLSAAGRAKDTLKEWKSGLFEV